MRILTQILCCLFFVSAAIADEAPNSAAPSGVMVDDIVELPFEPLEVYALFTNSAGEVEISPARYLALQTSLKNTVERLRYFLRAETTTKTPSEVFSFLALGADRKTAIFTPLTRISTRNYQLYQRTPESVTRGIQAVGDELEDSRAQLRAIADELRLLRDRASQIAGINDIVDLKVELANLQGRGQATQTEVQRLEALKMLGRHLPDPPQSKELQQQLLTDLKETAQVTATADRLNTRRRQAAAQTVEQKLALIKETQNYDPEQLGREVLRLRNIRRELQARVSGSNNNNQDF